MQQPVYYEKNSDFAPDFKDIPLVKPAIWITLFSLFDYLLILFFQMVLAKEFGATRLTDAYLGASTIPLLFVALMNSLLAKILIPVFFEYLSKKEDIWKLVNNIFNACALVLLLISVVIYILSPLVIKYTLPGFDFQSQQLSLRILRSLSPLIIFGGLIGLLNSIYYAQAKFILPNFAPLIKWLVTIVAIIALKARYGILSVPFAIVIGALVHVSLLIPIILRKKRFAFSLDLKHPAISQIIKLMIPLFIAYIFLQINFLLMRGFASRSVAGSISCIDFAYKIMEVVATVTVQGIAIIIFPLLSRYAAEGNIDELRSTFLAGQRAVMLLLTPFIIFLIILRVPVIQLLFERGAFDHQASIKTANIFLFFTGAAVGLTFGTLQSQVYYALKNMKRMMWMTVLTTVVFLLGLFVTQPYLYFYAIPFSFSLTMLVNYGINARNLSSLMHFRKTSELRFLSAIFAASLAAGLAVFTINDYLQQYAYNGFLRLGLSFAGGALLYFYIVNYILKIPEVKLVLNSVFKKAVS